MEKCRMCCGQPPRSSPWQQSSFMASAAAAAACNGVIVTMISFSPSQPDLKELCVLSLLLPSSWQSGGRSGAAHFISFQFMLNLLIPCWFCRVKVGFKKGEKYLLHRHFLLHLLAICVQSCMKGGRVLKGWWDDGEGWDGGVQKKWWRREGRKGIMTTTSQQGLIKILQW